MFNSSYTKQMLRSRLSFQDPFQQKTSASLTLKVLQAKLLSPSKEKGVGTGGFCDQVKCQRRGPKQEGKSFHPWFITKLGGKKTSGKKKLSETAKGQFKQHPVGNLP